MTDKKHKVRRVLARAGEETEIFILITDRLVQPHSGEGARLGQGGDARQRHQRIPNDWQRGEHQGWRDGDGRLAGQQAPVREDLGGSHQLFS